MIFFIPFSSLVTVVFTLPLFFSSNSFFLLFNNFFFCQIKYKNEIYENIKKSKVINHVCTLTNEALELKNNDHIPLNNDILILSVSQKDSHVLEKIINDY